MDGLLIKRKIFGSYDRSNTLLNPSVIEWVLPASWCLATWTHVRTTTALWRMSNTCFGALLDPHAPDYLIFHIRVSMIETHTLSRHGLMDIGCEKPTSRETKASESGPLWASGKSQRCVPGLMESWAPDVSTCLSQAVCPAGSEDIGHRGGNLPLERDLLSRRLEFSRANLSGPFGSFSIHIYKSCFLFIFL